MCARAFRFGVFDFIEKPADASLLQCIGRAIAHDGVVRAEHKQRRELESWINSLTPREREVLELLVAGKQSKQVALALGISPQTVAKHRARVFHKMHVESLADLVQLGWLLDSPIPAGNPP